MNKFQKNEYEIHFKLKLCQIKKNFAIINDIYQQNLTYFNFKPKTKKTFVLTHSDFWHVRMGHIDQKVFNKLSKIITDVKYSHKHSPTTKHLCEICAKANLISKIKKISNDKIKIYLKIFFQTFVILSVWLYFSKRFILQFLLIRLSND